MGEKPGSAKVLFILGAIAIIILGIIDLVHSSTYDPYKILGLSQYASLQDIRKVYKQRAKEWHPDKNKHPTAEHKFVEIKQAYELLSDNERRRIYDQHGVTNEDSQLFKQKHDYSNYDRYSFDQFDELFGKKLIFEHDIRVYHKLSVTTKYFEQNILKKSTHTPFIVMFYKDWCFRCIQLIGAFKKLIDTMETLGIRFATINAIHEQELVRRIGVSDVPCLVLVLNGHKYIYRKTLYTPNKVAEFIRKKMPHNIIQNIDDSNVHIFLEGWEDNKVRAIIIEHKNQTRLRYLISAFNYSKRIAFGFIRLNKSSKMIQDRYKIPLNLDTLLIFNEYFERPIAAVSMYNIPKQTINNLLYSHRYLTLPRLSSQDIFEEICPAEWNRSRKRLCVVLITENCDAHNFAREILRRIALQSDFYSEKVRFTYIYMDKQKEFINTISKGYSGKKTLRIVIIWRRDASHLKYEWITNVNFNIENTNNLSSEFFINHTKENLNKTIQRLLKTTETLSYETFVQSLNDEHEKGSISQLVSKITYITDYLLDNIEHQHILAALSLMGTILFMFAVGYIMVYFVRVEEEHLKFKDQLKKKNVKQNRYVPELKLYELRTEKYNGMVRLLKPGFRAIILITDLQTRPKLIPKFHKSIWPYRKSKTLIFGHMLIEKGLSWYSDLLSLSLCESKQLHINPRNCVGTVIALNGHRKYFCMYHAKHPETIKGEKRMLKMTTQHLKIRNDPEAGSIIKEENSDESDTETKILLEEHLLDGLNNWLDRLFEGSTHKYYINYWPDFSTK